MLDNTYAVSYTINVEFMSQIDPLSGIRFAYDINSFYLVCPLNFLVDVYYSVRGNARPLKNHRTPASFNKVLVIDTYLTV